MLSMKPHDNPQQAARRHAGRYPRAAELWFTKQLIQAAVLLKFGARAAASKHGVHAELSSAKTW